MRACHTENYFSFVAKFDELLCTPKTFLKIKF